MLTELQIRDYAIVDQLMLEFGPGMTVLTGETGAGKSIAVDALGIALGDRADTACVRHGCHRAEVIATFNLRDNPQAAGWLAEQELDAEDECILRRTVAAAGGSKAYINGRPVPAQLLRSLSELLIDIHSQHQHQSLLRRDEQRRLLDAFGGHEPLTKNVADLFRQWQLTRQQCSAMQNASAERDSRLDFLNFQLQELIELNIHENEWSELQQEHQQLANAESISEAINQAIAGLYDDEYAVLNRIQSLKHVLDRAGHFQPDLKNPLSMLENASIQLEEAVLELRHLADDSEISPQRLEWLDQRMSSLSDLARKHHCEPEDLLQIQGQVQQERDQLSVSEQNLDELLIQLDKLEQAYRHAADELSVKRKIAAEKLETSINALFPKLGMPQANLVVGLYHDGNDQLNSQGWENIEYRIATNPGQEPKPLNKVASGGELSRISLAVQVITSQIAHIPTLIFDEVDVGIGGRVAEVVGALLQQLGQSRQILCITHQAQVAAQGHRHMLVKKSTQQNHVSTRINNLEGQTRRDEIARMIGGIEITERTREHALEMLERAQAKQTANAAY